jgi:hypothetical protein
VNTGKGLDRACADFDWMFADGLELKAFASGSSVPGATRAADRKCMPLAIAGSAGGADVKHVTQKGRTAFWQAQGRDRMRLSAVAWRAARAAG